MSNRRAAWPRVRWLIGAAAVVLALAIVWALLLPGADWLARHDVGSARGSLQAARDAARGRLLTLGAGLIATGALVFTARNFTLSRRTFELTEQGQVTDRFIKAIELLGSTELDVRIGGIYALERVARDSTKDHPAVMEVLTAFIREHSRKPWPPPDADQPTQERSTRPDVQAAATVVGRRDTERDVRGSDLVGANLAGTHLIGANLAGTNLVGANLAGTHLFRANLSGAYLGSANLGGAYLSDAYLTDAYLTAADLTDADLTAANLVSARLIGANLTGTNLTGANLTGADLTDAFLGDRIGAVFAGANLTAAKWPAAEPMPEGWMMDGDSGRLKPAGQLSEVMTHYL